MIAAYLFLFWVPTIASLVLMLMLRVDGLGQRPLIPIVWFSIAVLLQFSSGLFSPGWVVGLVLQVVLARISHEGGLYWAASCGIKGLSMTFYSTARRQPRDNRV